DPNTPANLGICAAPHTLLTAIPRLLLPPHHPPRHSQPGAARSLAPLALTSRGRYPLLLIGTGGTHSVTATGRTPSPPRVGANEEPVARRRLTGIEQSRVLPGEQSSRITSSPRRCSMSRSSISTRAASSTAPAHRSPPAWR